MSLTSLGLASHGLLSRGASPALHIAVLGHLRGEVGGSGVNIIIVGDQRRDIDVEHDRDTIAALGRDVLAADACRDIEASSASVADGHADRMIEASQKRTLTATGGEDLKPRVGRVIRVKR